MENVRSGQRVIKGFFRILGRYTAMDAHKDEVPPRKVYKSLSQLHEERSRLPIQKARKDNSQLVVWMTFPIA